MLLLISMAHRKIAMFRKLLLPMPGMFAAPLRMYSNSAGSFSPSNVIPGVWALGRAPASGDPDRRKKLKNPIVLP